MAMGDEDEDSEDDDSDGERPDMPDPFEGQT